MTAILTTIDERVFLKDIKSFKRVLVPFYNEKRKENNERDLTEQEIIDLFLDKRKELGIDK